jgi:hypothetical protein
LLGYLLRYKSIGRTRAATHFDVWNLPKIIHQLKAKGYKFLKKGTGKELTYTMIEDTS